MRAVAVLLAAIALGAFVFAPAAGQDPIEVLNIDRYTRTVAPDEMAPFIWTVRNPATVPYNVTITATVPSGWSVTVEPDRLIDLPNNRAETVYVNVTAPSAIAAQTTATVHVVFNAFQNASLVFTASRDAMITIPSIYAEKRVLGLFPNFLPAPLDNEWGVFLLNVIGWAAISGAALLVAIPLIRKVASRSKTKIDDIIIRIVRTPFVILLFLFGTLQSLEALDRHIDAAIRDSLFSVYQAALTFIIIYLAYRMFKDVLVYLGRTVAKKTASHIDDVVVPLVEKIGVVVIGLVGLGVVLGYFNVDLSLFVAGGVVISMVLAFAAQDTISNFFSGLFILADRPFKEGDIVILSDGDWVEVRRIGMRTTRLFRFMDASLVTVPNNKLVNEKIANFSNPRDPGRIMKTFNVGYGSDPAKVKAIIQESIDATPHVVKDDPALKPIIRFDAMGESSLDFFILIWVDDRANRFTVQDVMNTEIYTRLMKAGIEIPFPQRTVHVRMEGAEETKPAPVDIERIARRLQEREAGTNPPAGGDDRRE